MSFVEAFGRSGPLEDARHLFLSARYEECFAALAADQSVEADLLRARMMLRQGRYADLLRSGFYFRVNDLPTHHRARAQVVLSAALYRSNMRMQAANILNAAKRAALDHGDAVTIAEATYQEAFQRWSSGEIVNAERALNQSIEWGEMDIPRLELLGALAGSRSNYREQITLLRKALDIMRKRECVDVWIAAWCLFTLAALVRELYDADLAQYVESRATELPWTPVISPLRCQVLRLIGWFHATAGRGTIAYDRLAQSASIAPNAAFTALTLLDRAFLAAGMGERHFSEHCLHTAEQTMAGIDWEQVTGDERACLLLIAELIAPKDPVQARFYLNKYDEIKRPISPNLAYAAPDIRMRALRQYTAAVVYRANRESRKAAELFTDAWRGWKLIGYDWRAARAAIHLGELQHRNDLLDYARETIKSRFPNIWFRRIAHRHEPRLSDQRLRSLSDRERQLFVMVLKGKRRPEIAQELRLSENTVRNRTSAMLHKLGINSTRSLLVAYADTMPHLFD